MYMYPGQEYTCRDPYRIRIQFMFRPDNCAFIAHVWASTEIQYLRPFCPRELQPFDPRCLEVEIETPGGGSPIHFHQSSQNLHLVNSY
jgi:hypothetical protein